MTSVNTKFVKMFFDSNGIPNFIYQDKANSSRHARFARKVSLFGVKNMIEKDITNNTHVPLLLTSTNIEKKCNITINQSYLFGILMGIILLLLLNVLIIGFTKRCATAFEKKIPMMKRFIFNCEKNLCERKTLNKKKEIKNMTTNSIKP